MFFLEKRTTKKYRNIFTKKRIRNIFTKKKN